jgi:glucosamine kinase
MVDSVPPCVRPPPRLGLGLDAGGTTTRWALGDADGRLLAEGLLAPIAGAMWAQGDGGRQAVQAVFDAAARAAVQAVQNMPAAAVLSGACAGITGLAEEHRGEAAAALAAACGLAGDAVSAGNDIELACRAAFCPGEGIVVYAGTGSIAAHLAADGALHRAGGRGPLIDDAGGGHWIGAQALRWVWRHEDACPGTAATTALGGALFARLGGSDWATSRAFAVRASRGEVGLLGLAVAEAADTGDHDAIALLGAAGTELARIATALLGRCAALPTSFPIALAGRVWTLHPAIEAHFRAALVAAPNVQIKRLTRSAHHAAATLAAGGSPE